MFLSKKSYPINPLPVDSGTSDYAVTRGMIEAGLVITVPYSVNVTGAGTAVRARSLPIKRVSLIGDNGKTLQAWKAQDLIALAQIWEQTPVGALIVPASAATVANYTGLQAHIPLMFKQPSSPKGDATNLPTFGYANLTLRIEWGSVATLFTDPGTLTGTITFTAPSGGVGGPMVTQLDVADFPIPSAEAGLALVRSMPVAVGRYIEMTQTAVANAAAELDLGTTANIRGILITAELGTTGEPTDTIVNAVSLQEDNTNYVFTSVPWTAIRADNSKHFGITMPTGIAVIDFAEDGDIFNIYRAVQKSKVKLILNTAAVAGTVRAALLTIEPPKLI